MRAREIKAPKVCADPKDQAVWERWFYAQNLLTQRLAEEYPPGSMFVHPAQPDRWIIGYTADGRLVLTTVNPADDYEGAVSSEKVYADPAAFRTARN